MTSRPPVDPGSDSRAAHRPGAAATAEARARAHRRVAGSILAVNGVLYFTLLLLIAFDKPLLGRLLVPGLSLAVLLGTIVTIAAWLLTLIYVRWANASDHAPGRHAAEPH